MSYLIAISVGPVQEFIAAARRTRDLWFGSYLLSELSRAAAEAVEFAGGQLIFPANSKASNVANIILAEVSEVDPCDAAQQAKACARDRWRQFADDALNGARQVVRRAIWDEQVGDVIEFYAAWVSRTDNYPADRKRVMRLLAARKNCRDFLPAKGLAGVPKSSLDGLRESVLIDPDVEPWPTCLRARMRISQGEQLDVVGVVKRVGGEKRPYPSVARIAADPWVRQNAERLDEIKRICDDLGRDVVHYLKPENFPQYRDFSYEGSVIYRNRHSALVEETGLKKGDLGALQKALKKIQKSPDEPNPYLAVLVADGDGMGAAIGALESPQAHREFSDTLAGFAQQASQIVADHQGVLVYAGGDDVLAFVPIDKCLDCAQALHDDFGTRLKGYAAGDQRITLSVGIAIAHFLENLEDLLELGRAAERAAKSVPGKDALAIRLHKRGGAPIVVQARWDHGLVERLDRFAEYIHNGTIPSKLPYELRQMATLYDNWGPGADGAIQQDLYRLIAKKTSRSVAGVRAALENDLCGMSSNRLRQFAQELLVARQLARTLPPRQTKTAPAEEVNA